MSEESVVMDELKPPQYSSLNLEVSGETKDEQRERELEEARARAVQMEKTMRWWSDCTANWREKWGKVRAERNKAKEENRQLKTQLETSLKEIKALQLEKEESLELRAQLEREIEKLERELKKDKRFLPSARVQPVVGNSESVCDRKLPKSGPEQQFIGKIIEKTESYEANTLNSMPGDELLMPGKIENEYYDENNNQQMILLKQKINEMEQVLSDERSSKSNLLEQVESLTSDLNSLKIINKELLNDQDGKDLEISRLKNRYEKEIDGLHADLDQVYTSSASAVKLKELRSEIEKLQAENALEWNKREKLETDKFVLERENKKLKHQVEDLESLLDHKTVRASKIMDTDFKALQVQLEEKNTELGDVRHAYNKIKKQLQEKTSELEHSSKRVEQHDSEVKKLRMRVEELKLEITRAEDEADSKANILRKTQRSLDEQTERVESLQVQVQHLTSRLRTPSTAASTRTLSSRSPLPLSSDETDSELDD